MWNAFYNPKEAIEDAKSFGGWGYTIGVLALSSIILALAPVIWMKAFVWQIPLAALVGFPIVAFLGALFLKIILVILDAKNPEYIGCLTAISYSLAPLSITLLAAVLLNMIPYAGIFLASLIVMIGGIASAATYLRGIVELAETDLLTSVVASSVVASVGSALSYWVIMSAIFSIMAAMTVVNATGAV